MKKIAFFCALCLFVFQIPFSVASSGAVEVSVSDVENDIITVKGTAPADTAISILILNPGKTVEDVETENIDAVQHIRLVYSLGGSFSYNIKMNTGKAPNKTEGAFSVFVTVDEELVYADTNFVFYSNETKTSYVNDLKNCTAEELLATEDGSFTKIEKIFKTFSFSNHELYKESTAAQLANVVAVQSERKNLTGPTEAAVFLNKVLVFNAFSQGSKTLLDGDGLKYTELWAKDGDEVSAFYTENFTKELNGNGKKAVVNALLCANYIGKEYTAPLEVLKDAVLLNVITNNIAYGEGHIESYMLDKFNAEYKERGFNTDALAVIKNPEKRTAKLEEILFCGATNIDTFKTKFNKIVTATDGSGSGSGGGGSNSSGSVPSSGGGGGGGFKPVQSPAPTEAPQETPAPSSKPIHTFVDMKGSEWADEAIGYLYEKGIINGRSEKTFAPSEIVTRAELVKMIVEAFGVADTDIDNAFSDVKESDWFAAYIKKAAAAGIVTGDGSSFRPNGGVTREDAAVIIFRALGIEAKGEITFTDADSISDYAVDAISAMSAAGYINGMGNGIFAPKKTLTRAQAAQLIYNALAKGETK